MVFLCLLGVVLMGVKLIIMMGVVLVRVCVCVYKNNNNTERSRRKKTIFPEKTFFFSLFVTFSSCALIIIMRARIKEMEEGRKRSNEKQD